MNIHKRNAHDVLTTFSPTFLSLPERHLLNHSVRTWYEWMTDYSASKFAAVGLTDALRLELKTSGKLFIKTTLVCPWMFDSGMFDGVRPG